MGARISLVDMKSGGRGTVVELAGGRQFRLRLTSLGLRPGASVVKETGPYMRGPVTVSVGRSRIAVGYGMAARILVELDP